MEPVADLTKVESLFIRERNVLALRAQFTPIYTDYYLHLMEQGLKNTPELDQILKELLASVTLHATARPWAETIAWTVNLRAPRVNFFVSTSSTQESIIGRLFTEDIRETDRNLLYTQTSLPNQDPRTSVVEIPSESPLAWVEDYYSRSEQRPGRCLELEDETFILLAAQPGFDEEWFFSQDKESLQDLEKNNETKLLETRQFRFFCGCHLTKILPLLQSWKKHPEELFQGDSFIKVQCPRCAAAYQITPDMLNQ